MEKDIDLFFGQQTVFRPSLPDHFELVGTNKAFLTYDRRIFKVNIPDSKRDFHINFKILSYLPLLSAANEVWEKVMFSEAFVCPQGVSV